MVVDCFILALAAIIRGFTVPTAWCDRASSLKELHAIDRDCSRYYQGQVTPSERLMKIVLYPSNRYDASQFSFAKI
jgi:hypothetical protein